MGLGDGGGTTPTKFADDKLISQWARDAVAGLNSRGIIIGKNNNLFDPKGSITRAEMLALLIRNKNS